MPKMDEYIPIIVKCLSGMAQTTTMISTAAVEVGIPTRQKWALGMSESRAAMVDIMVEESAIQLHSEK